MNGFSSVGQRIYHFPKDLYLSLLCLLFFTLCCRNGEDYAKLNETRRMSSSIKSKKLGKIDQEKTEKMEEKNFGAQNFPRNDQNTSPCY